MKKIIVLATAACLLATPTLANAAWLTWVTGLGQKTNFTYNGTNFNNQYTGSLKITSLTGPDVPAQFPSSFSAYCVDLDHFARSPQSVSLLTPQAASAHNAAFLAWLYSNINPTTNAQASGLQAAIWELEYDYDGTPGSINLTSGNFYHSGTFDSTFTNAQIYLAQWASHGFATGNATFLQINDAGHLGQDFMGPAVPEPGTYALAIGCLAALAIVFRRRRAESQA